MEKNRIANLNTYIEDHYPGARFIESSDLELPDFLQRDFDDSHNNCTIASLTRVINYYFRDKDKFEIYDEVMNLGSGDYKNHSLVISGYSIYKFKGMKVKFLHVYDGWNKTKSYIDYNDLRGFLKLPIFSYNVFDIDIGEDL